MGTLHPWTPQTSGRVLRRAPCTRAQGLAGDTANTHTESRRHRTQLPQPTSKSSWQDEWAARPQREPASQPQPAQPVNPPAAAIAQPHARRTAAPSARPADHSQPSQTRPQRPRHQTWPAAVRQSVAQLLQAAGYGTDWLDQADALPGFCTRLRITPRRRGIPKLFKLVIVEGLADCSAVHKAVDALVYVCDGSFIKSRSAARDLALLQAWPGGCIVLTDPDAPGRELRMFLDDTLAQGAMRLDHATQPPLLHAFVAVRDATAAQDTLYHEQGSTGIENAAPESVMYSLKHARPSFPSTRKDFTVKELQDLGLANTFNGQLAPGAKLRRKLVCDALGIDPCTGKSLANVLNRFFHRHELEAAMKRVSSAVGASDDSVDQAA